MPKSKITNPSGSNPHFLAMVQITAPEFWRGAVAGLEWLIREEEIYMADSAAANERPVEPGPSEFWAGWREVDDTIWTPTAMLDESLSLARKRYAQYRPSPLDA